jgi:hypothetical protein
MGPGFGAVSDNASRRVAGTASKPLVDSGGEWRGHVADGRGEVGNHLALARTLSLGGMDGLVDGLEVGSPGGSGVGEVVVPVKGSNGMGRAVLVDETDGSLDVRGNLGRSGLSANGAGKDGTDDGSGTHLERWKGIGVCVVVVV